TRDFRSYYILCLWERIEVRVAAISDAALTVALSQRGRVLNCNVGATSKSNSTSHRFFHSNGVVASMIIRELALSSRLSGAIAISMRLPLVSLIISTPRSGSQRA